MTGFCSFLKVFIYLFIYFFIYLFIFLFLFWETNFLSNTRWFYGKKCKSGKENLYLTEK